MWRLKDNRQKKGVISYAGPTLRKYLLDDPDALIGA
jgi:hypothetical protein